MTQKRLLSPTEHFIYYLINHTDPPQAVVDFVLSEKEQTRLSELQVKSNLSADEQAELDQRQAFMDVLKDLKRQAEAELEDEQVDVIANLRQAVKDVNEGNTYPITQLWNEMEKRPDKTWYLAELIQEFRAADSDSSLIHINWILVNARDAEEAYTKSLQEGQYYNTEQFDADGILVTVTFRGLRNLTEIHEELEDGAEIAYDEMEEVTDAEIEKLITPKDQLNVFLPRLDYNKLSQTIPESEDLDE